MMAQLITTDSEIPIPPKMGIVKTVFTFSSFRSSSASFCIPFPPLFVPEDISLYTL